MAYSNTSFETVGETSGEALGWTFASSVTTNACAAYVRNVNLLTYSNAFDDAAWTLDNATIDPDAVSGPPTYTGDADELTDDGTDGRHGVSRTALTLATSNTVSVFVKSTAVRDYLFIGDGNADTTAFFNLTTGELATTGDDITVSGITDIGSGWYRCTASFVPTATTLYIGIADVDGTQTYAGTTVAVAYLYGAQLSLTDTQLPYLGTTSTAVYDTRGYEDFEHNWDNDYAATTLTGSAANYFTQDVADKPYEDFEEGWDTNELFYWVLSLYAIAQYDTTPQTYEDFEQEWDSNEDFVLTFTGEGIDIQAAIYGVTPKAYENFEVSWSDNESFMLTFAPEDISAANYDDTPEAYEDFEEDWTTYMSTY